MIAALLLMVAVALASGCVFVPVGPPVVARPAVVSPRAVIVGPGHRGHHHGHHHRHHGGYRRGYGRHW